MKYQVLLHVVFLGFLSEPLWAEEKFDSMDDLMKSIHEFNRPPGTLGGKEDCPPGQVAAMKTNAAKPPVLPPTKKIKDVNDEDLELSVLDEKQAMELFKEIRQEKLALKNMEVCMQRAHRVGFFLQKKGIQSGKIFVNAGYGGSLVPNIPGNEKGGLRWNSHVASVVMVRKDGQDIPYIFDPAFFDRPVPQAEWEKMLTSHPRSSVGSIEATSRYIYRPTQSYKRMTDYDPNELQDALTALGQNRARSALRGN